MVESARTEADATLLHAFARGFRGSLVDANGALGSRAGEDHSSSIYRNISGPRRRSPASPLGAIGGAGRTSTAGRGCNRDAAPPSGVAFPTSLPSQSTRTRTTR